LSITYRGGSTSRKKHAFWKKVQDAAAQISVLQRKLQDAEAQVAALQLELSKRDEFLAELQVHFAALRAENERLRERVAELEQQLGQNSSNSSKPPSTDNPGSRPARKSKNQQKRKRGGQPGHRGSHRILLPPDQVGRVIDHYPDQCENCWKDLPHTPDSDPERYQVTELPPVKPETTEHRGHAVTCSCGHTTRAQIPDEVKASAFGPRLSSIMAMLTGVFQLGRRQVVQALADFFGVTISLGALSAAEDRVSKAVEPAVDEAWKAAQQADVKHADGTSWRQSGLALQLWTIATAAVTVFKVLSDGTAQALKTLLGRIKGVLVSDRATALNFWAMKRRQICWAHLLRKFVSFSERDGPAGDYGRVLLEYTGILFDYYRAWKDGQISRSTFRQRMAPVRVQLEVVLERATKAAIKGLSGSCADILAHREALWTFVDNPHVEPTNNHAERELRRFVLWRRRSFGTQSERGNRFAERIMTVAHTARKQGKPVLAYLTAACEAHRLGQPCPSLLAA
jgi:transposase